MLFDFKVADFRQLQFCAQRKSALRIGETMVSIASFEPSRMLRRERPDLRPGYWKGVLWSPPYFAASCGGAPIGILKAYIEQQKKPL
jgi:REP element-mobilizing transposase RayT